MVDIYGGKFGELMAMGKWHRRRFGNWGRFDGSIGQLFFNFHVLPTVYFILWL